MKSRCFLKSYLLKSIRSFCNSPDPRYVNQAQGGKKNFEKDFKKSHVETTLFQKALLGIGSGVISITSPSRGDMVAVMGEVTGFKAFEYVRNKMLESKEGKKILEEKPRISSASVNLEELKLYPEGTLGKAYSNFLKTYGYSPDSRYAVRFVDDMELAYVAQRYREVHDLLHTIFFMPTNMLGEVTVKWVEAIQTRLPMCATGALFGSVRLAPKFVRFYSTRIILKIDSELDKQIESGKINPKKHSGITHIKCQQLPPTIIQGIQEALKGQNFKMLLEKGQALERKLVNKNKPFEEVEINERKNIFLENLKKKYKVTSLNDLNSNDQEKITKIINKKIKRIQFRWSPTNFDKSTCLQYLIVRSPAEYAAVLRVFNEILIRDKNFQPSSIFDFGSGVGTVVWAANEIWGNAIKQYYCVDSSKYMLDLASSILKVDEFQQEYFIKNIYYRQFLPMSHLPHDIVVSSFSLFELDNVEKRCKILTTLWNNTEHYLVLIENGTNAGHDLILEARNYLIHLSRLHNIPCHVFAPCPHEMLCPRLTAPGKKTPCNFCTSYFNLAIPTLKHKCSNGRIKISYLILKKSEAPLEKDRQSRIVREVKKPKKHVVCHLCTNKGELSTIFIASSKSGKSAYKCMKQSHWGDLTPAGSTLQYYTNPKELFSDEDSDSNDEYDSSSSSSSDDDDGNLNENYKEETSTLNEKTQVDCHR